MEACRSSCEAALVHDAAARSLAVRLSWLPHVLRAATEGLHHAQDSPHALDACSRVVAVLNGENHTAWNSRRRVVLAAAPTAELFGRELALCDLALAHQPHRAPTWAYRRWLLGLPCAQPVLLAALPAFERECAAVERAATHHPRNYPAWEHRQWLLCRAREVLEPAQHRQHLAREHAASTEHCRRHVSDATALQYRRTLLRHMIEARVPGGDLGTEACWALALVRMYPGHEGIWYHIAFVLSALLLPSKNKRRCQDEKGDEEEQRTARLVLEQLDTTLPLWDDVCRLHERLKPSPQTLVQVVALIAAEAEAAATTPESATQCRCARHALQLSTSD